MLAEDIVGLRTPPRFFEFSGSESLAWFSTPVETLRRPMPEVEDRPTEELLRLGRLRAAVERVGVDTFTLAPPAVNQKSNCEKCADLTAVKTSNYTFTHG